MQLTPQKAIESRYHTLIICFTIWKAILLLLATCSPGHGYDTSTDLVLRAGDDQYASLLWSTMRHIVSKLTRWDGIYFVTIANRSYVFEQEWAFGWGWTRCLGILSTGLRRAGLVGGITLEGFIGILIANASHSLSVLVLYTLTKTLFPGFQSNKLGLTAALLHVISPAGLFLSAPYAESSCSFLTFAGCLLFTKSLTSRKASTVSQDSFILLSGILFGLATTLRSNAILSGLLLLEEAFRTLSLFRHSLRLATIRRLIFTGLGGICVALGYVLPQYLAYMEYCSGTDGEAMRPWCKKTVPSIYTFAQEHYWNVGPFRYWTLSNVPLFLLAAPMIAIMTISGLWALTLRPTEQHDQITQADKTSPIREDGNPGTNQVIRNLAISQIILTFLLLTTAHVQIINRVASSYPVWMWYLGAELQMRQPVVRNVTVPFMVMYSLVQDGLFASFLPPA